MGSVGIGELASGFRFDGKDAVDVDLVDYH